MSKFKIPTWAIILGAIVVIGGLGTAGIYFILQTGETGFVAEDEADFYSFAVNATLTGEEMLNVTCTPYTVSDIGLDDDDIAALVFADFTAGTAKSKIDATDEFDIEDYEDKLVIFKLTEWQCQDLWVSPIPGINNVTMMNASTDLNLIAFERDGGSFTANQTDDCKWSIQVKALNGTKITTGKEEAKGFSSPNFDFANDVWNYTVIRIESNLTTNTFTLFEMPDAVDEIVSGSYTYFYFSDDWTSVDFNLYNLNLASTLGTVYEMIGIAAGYGNLDSSVTIYDTQN